MGAFLLRDGGSVAQVRLGGVVRDRGRVLLHRPIDGDGPWAVPGGRLEVGELARDGLAREFREELGVDVTVGALLCVIENFFEHWPLDGPVPPLGGAPPPAVDHHELGLYFEVRVPGSLGVAAAVAGVDAAGTAHERPLAFDWVPMADLGAHDVRPVGLLPWLAEEPAPPGGLVTVR